MIYADLPAGETIFLDASVFIHHFEPNAASDRPPPIFSSGSKTKKSTALPAPTSSARSRIGS